MYIVIHLPHVKVCLGSRKKTCSRLEESVIFFNISLKTIAMFQPVYINLAHAMVAGDLNNIMAEGSGSRNICTRTNQQEWESDAWLPDTQCPHEQHHCL